MADTADTVPWRPPDWLIQLLRLPWKTRRAIVGNLAVSVIAGTMVAWLFFHSNDLKGTPFEWFIQNSWWLLSLYGAWIVITFIISPLFYLVPLGQADRRLNDKEVRRRFLMIRCGLANVITAMTKMATSAGAPRSLFALFPLLLYTFLKYTPASSLVLPCSGFNGD